jgi:hypothetical protein
MNHYYIRLNVIEYFSILRVILHRWKLMIRGIWNLEFGSVLCSMIWCEMSSLYQVTTWIYNVINMVLFCIQWFHKTVSLCQFIKKTSCIMFDLTEHRSARDTINNVLVNYFEISYIWRGVLDTTLCNKICRWLEAGRWIFQDISVFSINKTECHDITCVQLGQTLCLCLKVYANIADFQDIVNC